MCKPPLPAHPEKGVTMSRIPLCLLTFALAANLFVPTTFAQIFVKADAAGLNNGTSWADAYTDLQTALTAATAGNDVWVAAGTYKPTPGSDRAVTFSLKNGVGVYGGFAGTETMLDERDPSVNPTILSGEIGAPGTSDNSYHVVTASLTNQTAVLDGFEITAGRWAVGGTNAWGAGMYVFRADPTLRDLVFTANDAVQGGGLYSNLGNPTLVNVRFIQNEATYGGGMYSLSGMPQLNDVTFQMNSAGDEGGGLFIDGGTPQIMNSTFDSNEAGTGGGLNIETASPQILQSSFVANRAGRGGAVGGFGSGQPVFDGCLFEGNQATGTNGGAIWNLGWSALTVRNSVFKDNEAFNGTNGGRGGAVYSFSTDPVKVINAVFDGNTSHTGGGAVYITVADNVSITNTTFFDNSSAQGGALYFVASSGTVYNSISWMNSADEIFVSNSTQPLPVISHTMVHATLGGLIDGGNNILGNNPMFVNQGAGDLHLSAGSPAIDAGDNGAPDLPATDLDGNPRIIGSAVDMGAYEFVIPTGIGPGVAKMAPRIHSVFPNPFNPNVTITFDSGSNGTTRVSIYDVRGRFVRTLSTGPAGAARGLVRWDATDQGGRRVASGVYWVVVSSPTGSDQRRVVLLK
jgi:hypothetical protein